MIANGSISELLNYRLTFIQQIFIISMILLTFLSCNTDNNCDDFYILDKIEVFNVRTEALNEIEIKGYEKDNSFSKIIDSTIYLTDYYKVDSFYAHFIGYLNKDLNTNLDYKITFSNWDKICLITEIKVKESPCGGIISNDYSKSFDGYQVNGVTFKCQIIKVFPE